MSGSILRVICLVLLSTVSSMLPAQQALDRTLHIFVIDHSYSMVNKTGGQTRWEFVVGKLAEWTASLPVDGSADVLLLAFNGTVPGRPPLKSRPQWAKEFPRWGAADVGRSAGFVEGIGRPQDGEGTALWNALGFAMRRVDLQGGDYADAWIYLFTDGEDTNSSRDSRDRAFTFAQGDAGREQVLESWRMLQQRRPNTYLIEQPLGQMAPPLEPEAVNPANRHIYTSRPELNDLLNFQVKLSQPEYPDLLQEREIELVVRLRGTGAKKVRQDTTFGVSFAVAAGAAELAVEPAVLPLRAGKHRVRVRLKAGDAKNGLRGVLKLGLPDIEKTDLVGPTEIPIAFAKAASVSIANVVPKGRTRWPVGRPLDFVVQHTGEVVRWDLGDGSTGDGDRVQHAYQRPGEYTVKVTAEADGRASATATVEVTAVEAAVTLQQVPQQGVIVGKAVRFDAGVVDAKAREFDWQVDGGVRTGEGDGKRSLEVQFDKPGVHDVRVRAFTEDVGVLERTVKVQVGAGVSVRLSDFASSIDAGLNVAFEAEVGGNFSSGRVKWSFLDAAGNDLGPEAAGAAPVRGGISRWEVLVPRDLPAQVQLVAVAELNAAEQGRFGQARDRVTLNVRPPGLYMQKVQPVEADVVPLEGTLVFEARWTGTKASQVEQVQWRFVADGQPVRSSSKVQPSREAAACGATFSLDLDDANDLLGKTLTVDATPFADGQADAGNAAAWTFKVRLPRRSYRVVSPSLENGRLNYGSNLQVQLEPVDFVSSVRWDWGDGETEDASPTEGRMHAYGLDDGGARRVTATLQLVDGTSMQVPLLFDFFVPRIGIETTGVARLNRSLDLRIGPASMAAEVTEVSWDFGAGYGVPESDLTTSYTWTDRAGAVQVGARVRMRDGSERVLLPATVNVNASRTVRAAPEVVGGTTHGAVELRANVTLDSDYSAVEIDVFKDGEPVTTLTGEVASHAIVEGEYGDYEFRFRARRIATPENPDTLVELGSIGRTYRLKHFVLAFAVLAGGGFLLTLLLRGAVWKQYARSWRLRCTTGDILQAEDLSDLDTMSFPLRKKHWKWFQLKKQVDVSAQELVKKYGEDAADEGVARLTQNTSVLRISARPSGTLSSPGEQWDGPYQPDFHPGIQVFLLLAPRGRPGEKTLYAWLEAKNWSAAYAITTWAVALAALGAWIWFATARCFIF